LRICLVAPRDEPGAAGDSPWQCLATLLAGRHEVTLVGSRRSDEQPPAEATPPYREVLADPRPELARTVFAGQGHRYSAAVMEAIEGAYGSVGPDYVEVADRGAHGLVPLMARRCGNPLLAKTLFGVRLVGSDELRGLHGGALGEGETRLVGELEREQLRLADRMIWPGGDAVELYGRYYAATLPEAIRVGWAYERPAEPPRPAPRDPDRPLRILYAGDLGRAGGALDLAEACLRLPVDDWRLTMAGADTATAPGGQSAELTIGAMFGDDPRLTIGGPLSGEELRRACADHDLLVVPPTFAVWPDVALKGMAAGLPVLATPVGGLPEIVEHGETGWLATTSGAAAIRQALLRLLEDGEELERVRASGRVFERFAQLSDPGPVLAGYERLSEGAAAAPKARRPSTSADVPLVSGVVPYYRGSAFVEAAVRSLLGQTHPRLEAIVVNDGSFEPADGVLERLAADPRVRIVTQLNRGEASARNLGAELAHGEYVVMLDADNVLEPEFTARALEVFEREPELAYVSCWLRFIGPDGCLVSDPAGYAPLGNSVVRDDNNNWDGDTLALLPRRIFAELGFRFDPAAVIYSDWEFYRALREAGRFGTVIPERLARYRVLGSSLQRAHGIEMQRRGWDEARGRRQLRATRWVTEV
jgi:glycogen(starch) synthase